MDGGLALIASVWTFLIITGIAIMWGLLIIVNRDVEKRIDKYLKKSSVKEDGQAHEKRKSLILEKLGKKFVVFESFQIGKVIATNLQKAGLYLKVSEFLIITFVGLLMGIITGHFMGVGLAFTIALGILSGYVPFIYVKLLQKKRLAMLNSQIVDAFGFISNSLKAGHSFFQAMEHASREMPAPIALEFERVVKETNLGATTEEALAALGKRVESDDLDLVITAVLIQREIGGNLSEVLDNISNTIRERVRIKGEIKALTAQGRISGIVIALLPVFLLMFMLIVNPEYINILFIHPLGKLLLLGCVAGELLGALIISKIVNIRV